MKEKLATLLAYINNQEGTIHSLFKKIELLKPQDEDKMVNLAYQMHNLYSAYEDLFKEISTLFENNIERSSGFHKNLLIRMKLNIPGIRPNILSERSYDVLAELMAFRHVFRHAYNYTLSPDKMNLIRDRILAEYQHIENDLSLFKSFLEQTITKTKKNK